MHYFPLAFGLLAGWITFLVAYGVHHWRAIQGPPKRLNGWWHGLSPLAPRFTPKAWYDACQASMQRSRERRDDD